MRMDWTLAAGIALFSISAGAQAVPLVRLDKPDAVHPAEWTTVTAVRELKDGRLVVLDTRDQAVKLADFGAGTATMIGRKGSGPGEYQLPLALYAFPGDSSAIFDMANSAKPVVVTPQGKAGDVLPGLPTTPFMNFADHVDGRGRIYRAGLRIPSSWDGPIERLDRSSGKIDTMALMYRRAISPLIEDAPAPAETRFSRAGPVIPFTSSVQWDVAPDGSIALVSPEPYRVSFVGPDGKRTDGPVIPYDRIRVTDREKDEWRADRMRPVAAISYSRGGGQTTAGYRQAGPVEEPERWPEHLPPFGIAGTSSPHVVAFAPDGKVWVARSVAAGSPAMYDVVGRNGALAFRVAMPARTVIVGFGAKGIYAVQLDDDDIQHLERFRFPSIAGR